MAVDLVGGLFVSRNEVFPDGIAYNPHQ